MSKTFVIFLLVQLTLLSFSYCSTPIVQILVRKTGMAFDASENPVIVAPVNNQNNQKWVLVVTNTGCFFIKNYESGLVLDVQNGCNENGIIITHEKNNGTNQIFCINNNYMIGSACSPNFVLVWRNGHIFLSQPKNREESEIITSAIK